MSIYSALNVGVTALQAQSNAIGLISTNISNADTVGYKASVADFSTLLDEVLPGGYGPGGVDAMQGQLNNVEGAITTTNSATDVAIAGDGFFAVSPTSSANSGLVYTRAGSFTPDQNGNFVNAAGYYLQGWPLDNTGNLPASLTGTNVNSATAVAALQPINVQQFTPSPLPTSLVSIQAQLNSSQAAYVGPPAYNSSDPTANMASGAVTPDFVVPVTVIDSKNNSNTVDVGFLKTAQGSWAVEIYPSNQPSVTQPYAAGTVTFNGDGTLASISPSLSAPVTVPGTNGAAANSITFSWGTAGPIFGTAGATVVGKSDGLEQLDGKYNTGFITQNGIQVGTDAVASITSNGIVQVTYSNGSSRDLYQIPLAQFRNPDELAAESGNLYLPTEAAGSYTFFSPGQSSAAVLDPNALESSNADVASQLTDLIVAQNAYQANTKLLTTSNEMLQTLTQMVV